MPPLIPAAKLRPGRAEHDDDAAGHVLAAVVADALDHGARARVAHGEALAGEPAEERARRPWRRRARCCRRSRSPRPRTPRASGRAHRDHAAGEPLADVVVGVAEERELDAGREPGAERLPRRAVSAKRIVPAGRPRAAVALRDVVREQAADGAVDVADRELAVDGLAALERRQRRLDQLPVERVGERRVLAPACGAAACPAGTAGPASTRERSIPRVLPVLDRLVGLEQVDAADQILEPARCRAGP